MRQAREEHARKPELLLKGEVAATCQSLRLQPDKTIKRMGLKEIAEQTSLQETRMTPTKPRRHKNLQRSCHLRF